MKRINIIAIFLLIASLSFAAVRTPEEAAMVAARFSNSSSSTSMRRAPRMAASMRLAHTANKVNSEQPAYYVFNQGKGEGFIVVSADDRAVDVPLFAVAGDFDEENINPNLKFWLKRLAEELSAVNEENSVDKSVSQQTTVTAIAPLLVNDKGQEIAWDQSAPYNNLCPIDGYDSKRSLTGCVATASAQIMYKWRYPETGTGSKTYTWEDCTSWNTRTWACKSSKDVSLSANFGATTYDWDNMLAQYNNSATSAQKSAVATLMYHCGVACEMTYGSEGAGGSGAWTDDMIKGLVDYFGYTYDKYISMGTKNELIEAKGALAVSSYEFNVTASQFETYFNAELEAGRPILMGGEDSDGGHEFVCDGRNTSGYFHINWGWSGESNCYCKLTSLRPTSSDYNFSSNLDAALGLQPNNVPAVDVTGVTISPTVASIKKKGQIQLSYTIQPSNATMKVVSWSSDNNSVATVTESGLVKGVAQGTAVITVTTKDGSHTATCTVTVTDEEETQITHISDLDYLDAYYYTEYGSMLWDFDIYRATGAGGYPEVYIFGLPVSDKNKLAGTYESDYAIYYINSEDSVILTNVSITITRLEGTISTYNLLKYSIEGTATGEDGNTYTISAVIGGSAYDWNTQQELKLSDVAGDTPISGEGSFVLVTESASLTAGDEIIIVSADDDKALSVMQNKNNRGEAAITRMGTTIDPSDKVQILTLKAGKNTNTFALYTGDGYLYASSSSKNYLKTEDNLTANGSWSIIIKNGTAIIESVGGCERNTIMYNTTNNIFSCYASSAKMTAVEIYKKEQTSSAIDNVEMNIKVVKKIENGQVIIIRDGIRYNIMGIRL